MTEQGGQMCRVYTRIAKANNTAYTTAASVVLEVRRMREYMTVGFA
jgi:hypothetical protein